MSQHRLLCAAILTATIQFGANSVDNISKSLVTDVNSQNTDDVRFFLFTNPSDASQADEIIFNSSQSLLPSSFNCATTSKILIHGFTDNGIQQIGFPETLKIEYLSQYPATGYNIISVDWGPLATCADGSFLCYPRAALENVKIAGGRIGEFIVWLRSICGDEYLDLVHVLGYSLGAHVAGYAGYTVFESTGSRIWRLTCFDPAGPLFLPDVPSAAPRMMEANDGNYTDVYHTAVGTKGTTCNTGHTDVLINGGFAPQPGCGLIEEIINFAGSSEHSIGFGM